MSGIKAVQTGSGWDVDDIVPASGGGAGDNLLPVVESAEMVTKCSKLEFDNAQGSRTLLDTTGSNTPGIVSCIYLVSPALGSLRDGLLQVFVDGELTPSVNFELHNCGTYNIDPNMAGWTTRMQVQSGTADANGNPTAQCIVFKYPIFYKSSVRIVLARGASISGLIFTNVIYHEGVTKPWKLKTSSIGYTNRLIGAGAAQFENRAIKMLDRPVGQRGVIAGMSLTYSASQALSSVLENNLVVYSASQPLDGTADPLFNNSGTEDFFGDFYYFANEAAGNASWKYVIVPKGRAIEGPSDYTRICIVQDFLDHHGGIAYKDGAVMTFEKGKAATPGSMGALTVDLFYCVWYYEPY